MYLEILKVSRLGKICSQRTRSLKVLEKIEKFEKKCLKCLNKTLFFNDFVSFVMRYGDQWSRWLLCRRAW